MAIETLMQIIANGLVRGGVYILVALGLTLVLSIMNIVNFAHGQFYMLGAFAVYYLASILHINFVLAIVAAMLVVGIFGVIVIILGAVRIFVKVVLVELSGHAEEKTTRARQAIRRQFSSYLLLGLELLIAADIIKTIIVF